MIFLQFFHLQVSVFFNATVTFMGPLLFSSAQRAERFVFLKGIKKKKKKNGERRSVKQLEDKTFPLKQILLQTCYLVHPRRVEIQKS